MQIGLLLNSEGEGNSKIRYVYPGLISSLMIICRRVVPSQISGILILIVIYQAVSGCDLFNGLTAIYFKRSRFD
ncbi:hypothetical protein IWT5_00802 [Secundilactobacillus silagincola]|uniref:Uncharacterized protein n=1 Tax=Secundilactobacillus silagincola TaxID=1714681 RepID=A0A1Z5J1G2_9LACO|nr:hypothetical protein IWT5_00802 [Secundilactobacillus silagincola]